MIPFASVRLGYMERVPKVTVIFNCVSNVRIIFVEFFLICMLNVFEYILTQR